MKYLVFAVFTDGFGELATHSKEWDSASDGLTHPYLSKQDFEDRVDDILDFICRDSPGRDNLWEVFVWSSGSTPDEAPIQMAYWNQEDEVF